MVNEETGEERLFSVAETQLEQKEFNSKSQKKMRRYYDYEIGNKRLRNVTAGSAEEAYLWGKAHYPGEVIKKAYLDGKGDFHISTEYRPGVTEEVADRLAENVNKMQEANPKHYQFHRGLVAGRDTQKSARINYAEDMSNVNHRINARSLGDSSLKEEAKKLRVKKSIAHHQEVIDALKAKKAKNIKNGKIALGIGAAGLATLGGVAAYKHYKKNKKEKEDK
jgi:hypothetical protein